MISCGIYLWQVSWLHCGKTKDNRRYQWNYKLRKDNISKHLARLTEEKRELKQNQKWKRRYYNWYHRNTKDHKNLLWTIIHQQVRQPRRNGYSPRNIQPTKTESWLNKISEQTNYYKEIESLIKNLPKTKVQTIWLYWWILPNV